MFIFFYIKDTEFSEELTEEIPKSKLENERSFDKHAENQEFICKNFNLKFSFNIICFNDIVIGQHATFKLPYTVNRLII